MPPRRALLLLSALATFSAPSPPPPSAPSSSVLSWRPRVKLFDSFVSPTEAAAVIALAEGRIGRSVARVQGTNAADLGSRRSRALFLDTAEDALPLIRRLKARVAEATMHPVESFEKTQIQRYDEGGFYVPHYDPFVNPKRTEDADISVQASFWRGSEYPGGQRIATFLVYLTDVAAGGDTLWPEVDVATPDAFRRPRAAKGGLEACGDAGKLRVRPKLGRGVLFYSVLPSGDVDLTSWHGSCPVHEGVKWVAQFWIRDRYADAISDQALLALWSLDAWLPIVDAAEKGAETE